MQNANYKTIPSFHFGNNIYNPELKYAGPQFYEEVKKQKELQ